MRLFLRLFIIIGLQVLVSRLLISVVSSLIVYIVLMSLFCALLFAFLNYPIKKPSIFLKDIRFHKQVAIYFIIFFIIDMLTYYVF